MAIETLVTFWALIIIVNVYLSKDEKNMFEIAIIILGLIGSGIILFKYML